MVTPRVVVLQTAAGNPYGEIRTSVYVHLGAMGVPLPMRRRFPAINGAAAELDQRGIRSKVAQVGGGPRLAAARESPLRALPRTRLRLQVADRTDAGLPEPGLVPPLVSEPGTTSKRHNRICWGDGVASHTHGPPTG